MLDLDQLVALPGRKVFSAGDITDTSVILASTRALMVRTFETPC
ncbi:MAG: hypothetical protein ACT4QD_22755 [Acidobacteriota bacterium]